EFSLVVGELKPHGRHADDGVAFPVERDAPADDGWVAREAPPPQSMTQNHYPIMPWPILFIEKSAAQCGLNVEQREEAGRDECSDDSRRLALSRQIEAG